MTHTVCGSGVRWFLTDINPIERTPYCPLRNRTVDTSELGPDRVSPGRAWELQDDDDGA